MDRVEEWRVFVAVATHRSFAKAAHQLGRSPQAITRAVAAIEARLGTRLLHRTTRSVTLTGDGARYLEKSRHVVAEVDSLEAPLDAKAPLAGTVSLTAPVLFGHQHVVPIVHDFLGKHAGVCARLVLVDRIVSLADEGLDLAVRIGALPDSALLARVVGHVRLVTCASPRYLARAGVPRTPESLGNHACIALTGTTPIADRWSFPHAREGQRDRSVAIRPRLVVNTGQAAIEAALAGLGVVRVLSYQVERLVADGRLQIVLPGFEPPAVPIQVVHLPGAQPRIASAFVEHAIAQLTKRLG